MEMERLSICFGSLVVPGRGCDREIDWKRRAISWGTDRQADRQHVVNRRGDKVAGKH